jgi:hypothetical protein
VQDVLAAHKLGIFCRSWIHIMGSATDAGPDERSAKGDLVELGCLELLH